MKASNQLHINALLTSRDVIVLSRVTGVVSQLAILDTHWTTSAINLSKVSDAKKTGELREVVDALEQVLAASQPDFSEVGDVFQANAEHIRHGFSVVMSGKARGVRPPPPDRLAAFKALVDGFGGDMAEAAIDASRRLSSSGRIEAERKLLNDEFSKLSAGGASGGDLTDEQWTDVHLVAMGAAIVLGAEAGLIVEAAAGLWELIFG